MTKKTNSLKNKFIAKINQCDVENEKNKFRNNISFDFQFFDNSQDACQDFKDLSREQLFKLIDKLKEYCKNTPTYWQNRRIGAGGRKVFVIYGAFPEYSDFEHPKHVPLDVDWARFRLESDMRLIGFMVNEKTCEQFSICKNVFHVVFLDPNHGFYKSK